MTGILNNPFQFGFLLGVFTMVILAPFFFWMGVWMKTVVGFFRAPKPAQDPPRSPFQALWQMLLYILLLALMILLAFFMFQALHNILS